MQQGHISSVWRYGPAYYCVVRSQDRIKLLGAVLIIVHLRLYIIYTSKCGISIRLRLDECCQPFVAYLQVERASGNEDQQ